MKQVWIAGTAMAVAVAFGVTPDSVRGQDSAEGLNGASTDPRAGQIMNMAKTVGANLAEGKVNTAALNVVDAGIDYWFDTYGESLPAWAQRMEFELNVTEDEKPEYSILTVQPLWQGLDMQDTVFFQGQVGNSYAFNDERITTNIGFGYRRLFDGNKALAGVNAFYDRDWDKSHNRASIGGELRWNAFDLNINNYWGLSGWKDVGSGNTEKAMDGRDIVLAMQLPYLPWAKVRYKRFEWEYDSAARSDVSGWKAGLEMDLSQNLQLEASYTDDNYNESKGIIQLRWQFGGSASKPVAASSNPIAAEAYAMRDMSNYTLDKVQRTNRIVTQRSSGGVVISRTD